MKLKMIITIFMFTLFTSLLVSAPKYKPFILASNTTTTLENSLSSTKSILSETGFTIVGEYSPIDNRQILIITNGEIINNASKTMFGGFGATLRVSFTELNGKIQLSYTNPIYWAHAFQLKLDNAKIFEKLKNTLGYSKEFGSEDGLNATELKKYHYMFGMPYFDDMLELGESNNHQTCIDKIETGLSQKLGGVEKVYRVDLPGKMATVFGVAINKGKGSDSTILSTIDNVTPFHTAHLPYEILVVDNKIYALHAKFRIAISWPDLSMMGEGSFASIMSAPGEIEDALKALVNK